MLMKPLFYKDFLFISFRNITLKGVWRDIWRATIDLRPLIGAQHLFLRIPHIAHGAGLLEIEGSLIFKDELQKNGAGPLGSGRLSFIG